MPVPIILPKFGFTLESSTIVQWLKHDGDTVRSGDPIAEVTTDKVNMEIEAPEAGTLYGLRYKEGDDVPVTEVICYLARPGEPIPAQPIAPASAPVLQAAPTATSAPGSAPAALPATPLARRIADAEHVDLNTVSGSGRNGRITRRDVESALGAPTAADPYAKVRATPAARHLAAEAGIDLAAVAGSGPRGRVQGADVQSFAAQHKIDRQLAVAQQPTLAAGNVAVVGSGPLKTVKLTGMRKTIATRLQQSYQTAPHIFVEMQVDTGEIDALRAKLKARDEKLSVTAILVRACATALQKHPYVNATLQQDEITLWDTYNIGVAVALDDGLVVPVIHHAEQLSLKQTQHQLDVITNRARGNALHVTDVMDGTFTISNLGMYGVDRFTAIINPPQVAILAVGRTQRMFVPDANGSPIMKSFMALTLSADHRVVDGANAAQFLADLKTLLEDPVMILW